MRAKGKVVGVLVALFAALGLVIAWGPTTPRRVYAKENQAARALEKREVHISPLELVHLLHNRQLSLRLLDLRNETAFNTFHLIDAKRFVPTKKNLKTLAGAPARTVTVFMDEDETMANAAYLKAIGAGASQIYILEGGVRAWLDRFAAPDARPTLLSGAMGDRHPASYPSSLGLPTFVPKVKLAGAGGKKSAGCGG